MIKLAIFALAVVVASAHTDANWLIFKSKYNKDYSGEEDIIRRFVWQSNLKKIEEHNELYAQGLKSYYLGENKYADMTNDEFNRVMNGMNVHKEPGKYVSGQYKAYLPASVDWRKKGYVTPIKDQGQCGSCWAFSVTGSLEGQHFNTTGKLVSLSESNLIDCSQKWGNDGCDGGIKENAFQYVIDNKGIDTEKSYPYKPEDRACNFKRANVGATAQAYQNVTSGSEDALQKAVAEVGPISVIIDGTHLSFQFYRGGVYDEPACTSAILTHAILVVGYGTHGGQDTWIVKNNYGTKWGIDGYILMSRNKNNQCGIATAASYPTGVN
ncbi:cathepsin L1 [Aplysia californica]|uniref:Cathepsin L1 n=1 Tax=Aplysia californica TaxID=6500 RepID=A0ABM1VRY0_APLCA|nr:cathepsin L1 [Aplysia californica]